jgi:7-keto-8-aminopelargonate synthetase-like enzyme
MADAFAKPLQGSNVEGPISARIRVNGREYVNFFGAGYLALGGLPELRDAALAALRAGAPFAQQLPRSHGAADRCFEPVEETAAQFLGCEASAYFASGYLVGMVAMRALQAPFDLVFLDQDAHHSLRDAARLAEKPIIEFAHADADALALQLKRHVGAGQMPLVMTDGVFATLGVVPPLDRYAELLRPFGGKMIIDESHAFGVIGTHGRGAADYHGVEAAAISGTTLTKAACAQGAIIGGSVEAIVAVREKTPFAGSCQGSPVSAAVAAAALGYMLRNPSVRDDLRLLAGKLRAGIRALGLQAVDTPAPIVTFSLPEARQMREIQMRMFERGFYLHYSTYVGASPQGVIRCALFRDHQPADIEALLNNLKDLL